MLNFKVHDLDLKDSEGVGMAQCKSLDQYLISGQVSSESFITYRLLKSLTIELKHKISKSMTLTSRSLMWVKMVQHKTSDHYLTSGKISTKSIQRFRKYRLLKT